MWVHNANCRLASLVRNWGDKTPADPRLLPDLAFESEMAFRGYLKANPASEIESALVPKLGAEKLNSATKLKHNEAFEDGVASRIEIAGVRQEYAVTLKPRGAD